MSWWGQLERRMVEALLRTPSFTRGVQKVHQSVHRIQHGKPPEYHQGGTQLDEQKAADQGLTQFFKYFWEELRSGHKPQPKNKK